MANRTKTTRETIEIRRKRQEALDMLEGRIPAPEFTMLAFDDWRFAQTAAQVHQLVGGSGMTGTLEFYTFIPECQNGLAPPHRGMDQAQKQQNRTTHIPTYYDGVVPPLTARREAEIETIRRLTMAARGRDPDDERQGFTPNSRPPLTGSAQEEDDDIREAIAASLEEMQAEQDHNDVQAAIAASLAEMKAGKNTKGRNQHQKTHPNPAPSPHPAAPSSPKSDEDSDTQAAIAASLADSREDPDTQAAIAASLADMREQKRKKPASPKRPAWNAHTPRGQKRAASPVRPAAARAGTSSNPSHPPRTPPRPVPSNINSSEPRTLRNLSGSVMERLRHPFRTTRSMPTRAQTPRAPPGQTSRSTPRTPTPTRVPQNQTTTTRGGAQRLHAPQRRTPSPPSRTTQRERLPVNNADNRNCPPERSANTRLPRPAVSTPAPIPGSSDRQLYPRDPTTGQFLSNAAQPPTRPQREHLATSNVGTRNRPAAQRSDEGATNNTDTRIPRPAVPTPAPIPGRSDRRLYPRDSTTGQFLSDADWDAQIM